MTWHVAPEVADALASGSAVVALESTLLAHGLPPPRNRELAARAEAEVRSHGAVPATIAVLGGVVTVGLTPTELDTVCDPQRSLTKLSVRDLGPAIARGLDGATTVASTALIARAVGVRAFATGGLGGVHRDAPSSAERSWDVSADLDVLASTPLVVVCSGVKSVLDIGATLELLETRSVPVIGYGTSTFPAFYLRESDFTVPWRADSPGDVAADARAHWEQVGARSGLVVANPVPVEAELDRAVHDAALASGLALLAARGVRGKDVTPVLLEHFHATTGGASLRTNEELVLANAALAAQIAVALAGPVGEHRSEARARTAADNREEHGVLPWP